MALYNLFVKEVPTNTWTAEGGTALECIGKTEVEPAVPGTATKLKTATTTGVKFTVKFDLTKGAGLELKELLEAGGKATAATLHFYGKAGVTGKTVKMSINAPVVSGEPSITNANGWFNVVFSEAQAKELTATNLVAMVATFELILAKATTGFEVYLSVEAEAGATTLQAKPTITLSMKDTVQVAQTVKPLLTARFVEQDTVKAAQTLAASVTSRMTMQDTVRATQTLAAALSERMVLGDGFAAVQTTVAKFVDKLEFKESLTATFGGESKLEPQLTDRMVLGFGLTAAQAQSVAMSDKLKFQTTIKAVFKPETTAKRVTIFIFED